MSPRSRFTSATRTTCRRRAASCTLISPGSRRPARCAFYAGSPIPISCWRSKRSPRCDSDAVAVTVEPARVAAPLLPNAGKLESAASNSARLIPHYCLTSSIGRSKLALRTCAWEIARGIGDVSLGRFPSHYSRLDAPPLSTGAALHARPGTEVVRASRPIVLFAQASVGFVRASRRRHRRDRQLTPKQSCRRTPRPQIGRLVAASEK